MKNGGTRTGDKQASRSSLKTTDKAPSLRVEVAFETVAQPLYRTDTGPKLEFWQGTPLIIGI